MTQAASLAVMPNRITEWTNLEVGMAEDGFCVLVSDTHVDLEHI